MLKPESKKRSLKWVYVISVAVFIVCILLLAHYLVPVIFPENYESYKKTTTTIATQPSTTLKENPYDFKSLQTRNDDIYAWIKIPNTNVDYPVAQAWRESDSFYLNHGIDKTYDPLGMIYSEKMNTLDFSDPHTVLYGHNYLGDKMFRTLYKFKDKEFFDKNQYIYIYTPDRLLTYRIFAAYEYDDRHLLNSFNFHDKTVFREYLEEATNPTSLVCNTNPDVEVTENDKILTLSTCVVGVPTSRYLVQGVLISDEPTA